MKFRRWWMISEMGQPEPSVGWQTLTLSLRKLSVAERMTNADAIGPTPTVGRLSAPGQVRTHAPHPTASLFDHFAGAGR